MMWNSRKIPIKVMRFSISFFLILCLFVTGALKEYGPIVAQAVEDSTTTYVNEIRLFYSMESIDDARAKCESAGFIPVDGDLNEGADRNHVVMGYTETDERQEAICSIKLLGMNDGYELKDYSELQKEYESSNSSVIDTVEAAAQEFIGNYEMGAPKALVAYDGLNLIEIPEAGDKKLGDYIVDGDADWDFYAKVVTRASSGTVSNILTYLSMGISPYENEYDSDKGEKVSVSWAASVKDSIVWDDLREASTEDEFNDMYMEYGDDARAFHKRLQEFAAGYENAMATFDEAEYAEDLEKLDGKTEEEIVEEKEELTDSEKDMMYIAVYEELEQYEADGSTNLAEYLVDLGNETSDEVELTKLYPIIDSMTYAERRIAAMSGLPAIIQTTGENEDNEDTEEVSEKISEASEHLEELIGSGSYSIWLNGENDIMDKKVAYTSDAIRMDAAQRILDKPADKDKAAITEEVFKWVNLALGIVSCILTIAKFAVVAKVLALIPAGICALASAMGLTTTTVTVASIAGKIAAGASTLGGPVGWITMAMIVVAIIIVWVVGLIQKYIKEKKDIEYEDAPDYVADRVEDEDGAYTAYYKGAGSESCDGDDTDDYHGTDGISDVNGRMGFRGWNCIFYSKDVKAGSPIVVEDGQCPFSIRYGDEGSDLINGYDCVKSFGEITPGNCNDLMKEDEKGGVFIHYRTEDSVKGVFADSSIASGGSATVTEDGKVAGVYYKDLIVRSGDTEASAKAKIKKKGFKLIDKNIANDSRFKYSRHEEWAYSYIGFTTTTNPKQAITDIRVATYCPNTKKELYFGGVKYGCAGNLGYRAEDTTEDKNYPADLDGLWITTDERAGTPIEYGGLHVVDSHKDGEYVDQGWIPVTTFSGVPYNFATTRDTDTTGFMPGRISIDGYSYTSYSTDKDHTWDCPARYIYYEPLEKYTSGTKYLSAVFFLFGTTSEGTAAKLGETEAEFSELIDRMKKTPNTVIKDDQNLASPFVYKGFIVESNQKYLHIGYSWSYNPYRALCDIKAFQGTIYASNLPYTISKPSEGGNVAYDAVTVITQRSTQTGWVSRGIGPENAYMYPTGLLGQAKHVAEGYTSYQPGGYDYFRKKMPFIATGLYVSGPTDGAEKLTLDDVVITSSAHDATNNGGIITADVSSETTLGGVQAEGTFNSIQEMKAPHETTPFNIAYPEWTNDDDDSMGAATPLYIYIRKPAMKKKYISSIAVGSFQFSDSGAEADVKTNREVAKQADLNALVQANGAGTDEVIPANVSLVEGKSWYDIKMGGDNSTEPSIDSVGGWWDGSDVPPVSQDRLPWLPPEIDLIKDGKYYAAEGLRNTAYIDHPASYLCVSRTDDANKAIRGLLLFKSDEKTVAEKIQVGGVEYTCASASTPIIAEKCTEGDLDDLKEYRYSWSKQKYFLYYTTNRGVTPGQPITEITIDSNVFNTKQATVLCVDKKDKVKTGVDGRKTIEDKAVPYGDGDLPKFIHASYEKDANAYFNKIYTATGKTKKAALIQLLEQGCTEFCDINLNEGVSLTAEEIKDEKEIAGGGEYVYFGYRGFSVDPKKKLDDQLIDAVYDVICTVGKKYRPEGIMTERYQLHYAPVVKVDKTGGLSGSDLNAGSNGPAIYMYYTTPWVVSKYNEKLGNDTRKNRSASPVDYLKSPLTRIAFTRYDRVPYSKESGVDSEFGDDSRAWEYILYDDSKTPVDLNDGTVKFDDNYLTENNKINMFAQREDGSVKTSAEITGGYVSDKAELGEMWLNR